MIPRIALRLILPIGHRAVRSSKTTATTGVRVLFYSRAAPVPPGAAAAAASAAAECSRARDCLATPCSCLSRARRT